MVSASFLLKSRRLEWIGNVGFLCGMQEARSLARCRRLGVAAPTLFLVDLIHHRLYMERIENAVRMRDFLESVGESWETDPGSSTLPPRLESLAAQIGRAIAALHAGDLIHGDLTTSNFLVQQPDDRILLIDFGLSQRSTSDEDKAVDLMVLERALESTHTTLAPHLLHIILANYADRGQVLQRLDQVRQRGRKRLLLG